MHIELYKELKLQTIISAVASNIVGVAAIWWSISYFMSTHNFGLVHDISFGFIGFFGVFMIAYSLMEMSRKLEILNRVS